METTTSETTGAPIVNTTQKNLREKILPLAGLAAILLLAAALRFTNIDSLGYVNHYYAAAVKSMLQSWHNFFFVAAEPGGSVSVDKPPVGLWLQAISAYFLGVNALGLLMPQILAGLASVMVVYHLVRRSFGSSAGLLAALALAVTPVAVAVDRNNTIDSTMILTLLLAAWAFIKATETSKIRYLLLGATLVGIAFNIKMLAAYLPVPAFFALYFLGARETFWRKIGKLTLTGLMLLVVSFSWALAVDLTPAEQRPYVGSSGDNSELTLIVGYNGLNRLVGMARNRGMVAGTSPATDSLQPGSRQSGTAAPSGNPLQGNPPQGNFAAGTRPQGGGPQNGSRQPSANQPQAGPGGGLGNSPQGGGGGGTPSNIGQAGPFRLFTSPLSKEMSWLLPVGLMGMALLLAGARLKWPLSSKHQVLVLWGGWLLTGGVFFSIASYYHEYYLSLLGAPLAALVGIGIVELWEIIRKRRPLFAIIIGLVIAGVTMGFQIYTARAFVNSLEWLPLLFGVFLIGAVLLIVAAKNQTSRNLALAGFTLIVLSLFITPGIWSAYTAMNPGNNLSLPAAYSGKTSSPANRGSLQVNQDLVAYLEANTHNTRYLMAVPTSMQGADYVLATGRPVLYMGGFKGSDAVVSANDLEQLVQAGELRYIYLSGGNGTQSGISSWATSACTQVEGFETTSRNAGAPDGTTTAPISKSAGVPGNNQTITLYDCGDY
jgi:4-amino-4-deoxy-L-arabinose transferase-like glycosyltransferase